VRCLRPFLYLYNGSNMDQVSIIIFANVRVIISESSPKISQSEPVASVVKDKVSLRNNKIIFKGKAPLNVYTGQNPRWHVVLKKTSQMRIICTQTRRDLSACFSKKQSL
jgi:hypothetical protein